MKNQTEHQTLIKNKEKKKQKKNKSIYELKTPGGYKLDEVVSSLQKAIRRGQEEKALFWMMELIKGRYIAYLWRRLSVIVVEDIGLADPSASILINALAQLNERVNKKYYTETFHPAMAVLYLCRAKKSREVDYICDYIDLKRKSGLRLKVPPEALDEHTEKGRELLKQLSGDYQKNADEKFYYEGILLNKPVSIEGDKYKKKVWKLRKLDKKKLNKNKGCGGQFYGDGRG